MTNQALTAPVRDAGARPIVAPLDKDAIKAQLARLEDPETLELQQRLAAAYDKACAALIGPNDEQEEKGRKFKKKSAWRKLGRHFGISTTIVREDLEQLEGGEFIARCLVRAFAPWGQQTDATGACGSDEESGRRTITMADAIATAQTRATNRAVSDLVAMGEVSAEEIGERAPKNGKARPSNRPELTLEEALELEFPWRNHAKYGGKKLAEVSTRRPDPRDARRSRGGDRGAAEGGGRRRGRRHPGREGRGDAGAGRAPWRHAGSQRPGRDGRPRRAPGRRRASERRRRGGARRSAGSPPGRDGARAGAGAGGSDREGEGAAAA